MKRIFAILLFLGFGRLLHAQQLSIDSLRLAYSKAKADTSRTDILWDMANTFIENHPDSSLFIAEQALLLSRKTGYTIGELRSLKQIAEAYQAMGNYPIALQYYMDRLQMDEKNPDAERETATLLSVANLYQLTGDYTQALVYAKKGYDLINKYKLEDYRWYSYMFFGDTYEKMDDVPNAKYYNKKAFDLALQQHDSAWIGMCLNNTGNTYAKGQLYDSALHYYYSGIPFLKWSDNESFLCESYLGISSVLFKTGHTANAIVNAKKALELAQSGNFSKKYLLACQLLADIYKNNGHLDSAYIYLHSSVIMKDSLYNMDKIKQFQALGFNETMRKEQNKNAQKDFEAKIKIYSLIGGMVVVMVVAFILYRNNKQKQSANTLLKEQKQEIESTLKELRSAQSQLIQAEKMASLGELTAGIAHEIQNPLNFVNNFSDVNTELINEQLQELKAGNVDGAIDIANDIKLNESRINQHGRRADAIVKGMLQHSRTSSGVKEPTDMNKLAGEYLRLSFQGLRAKDKTFQADIKTTLDENAGKINIIPQDIGRVLLNLYNNAFYSVNQKQKGPAPDDSTEQDVNVGNDYKPAVVVSTKKVSDKVFITIQDNGFGIPKKIVDKIFQPFFTTKPSGEGTGLGLSLSYDIIKAHGGEIKVETEEGEGTTFIIQLPVA